MAIPAIGSIGSLAGIKAPSPPSVSGTSGDQGFGGSIANALGDLSATQKNADQLAVKAATGDLAEVSDYTIAAAQASLQTELVVAIRDRAVEAFNEIMRMQL
jgi:flagellar hook-basal body complex protein FliE